MKTLFKFLTMAVLVLFYSNCKNETKAEQSTQNVEVTSDTKKTGQAFIEDKSDTPNALRLAIDSPDHTTLVAAVQAAEVENALVNVGPLTVFAPTNGAFGKIDANTLSDLLKPENKSQLAFILKHHVAPSNYPIETLKKNAEKNRKLYMASGQYLEVTVQNGDIYVGGTKIVATVNVSNGWVHVVEDVILPQ
ncbi:fasciclin domain-containing protein [Paucihalobacter ruber]|uniref:Fasciclin domain-containing protein n=1 Tax=Paucihalobacter ruber TaxID=2567861 RepID=A0A506PH81_9FLAO|nr:fasciclin domain-containing protein [Paucihalobacter ruber]TPV32934.1 fasciclin domain-containing protein [Paucihalobacter ruber]